MRLIWRIAHRFYKARSRRATKAAHRFEMLAEKFFRKIKGRA